MEKDKGHTCTLLYPKIVSLGVLNWTESSGVLRKWWQFFEITRLQRRHILQWWKENGEKETFINYHRAGTIGWKLEND